MAVTIMEIPDRYCIGTGWISGLEKIEPYSKVYLPGVCRFIISVDNPCQYKPLHLVGYAVTGLLTECGLAFARGELAKEEPVKQTIYHYEFSTSNPGDINTFTTRYMALKEILEDSINLTGVHMSDVMLVGYRVRIDAVNDEQQELLKMYENMWKERNNA